jgi:hypothetical protein
MSMRFPRTTVGCLSALTVIAVTVVLFFQFAQYVTHAIFPWTRYAYHGDSMEPVDVVLGKRERLHLRIPGAYLSSLPVDSQGVSSSVQLEAYLPDMLPKSSYYAQHPMIVTHDLVAIAELRRSWLFLTLSSVDRDSRQGFFDLMAFYKHTYTPRPADGNSAYEICDRLPPFDGHGSEYMHDLARWTMYFPNDSNDYYVDCNGEHTSAYSCHIDFIYKDNTQIDGGMEPNNLSRSEYVRKTVSDFLNRLITTR